MQLVFYWAPKLARKCESKHWLPCGADGRSYGHVITKFSRMGRLPHFQPRPQGFSLKKWVGREKALASAGHVYSLNIPEKLIYMQPAGFALTEVERSNNGK